MSIALDTRRPFSTLATIDGYEVVDENGRTLARKDTLASANGAAFYLNNAAQHGPKALARALGAEREKAA